MDDEISCGDRGSSIRRIARIPALDGLRGLAVVAVLTLHAGIAWFRGGFLGVDLFFVLSGFLITLLLLAEHAKTDAINLGHFYARRALRLLPAFVTVILFCVIVMVILAPKEGHGTFGAVPLSLFYLTDFSQAYSQGHLGLLGHTWSLSIEEHFYLIWPLALTVMLKRRYSVRFIAGCLVTAIALSSLYKAGLWLTLHNSGRAYYEPQARIDALGVGCLAAIALRAGWLDGWDVALRRAAPICIGVFAAGFFVLNQYMRGLYLGGGTVLAIMGAIVIVNASRNPLSRLNSLLSWRPLVGVGMISYGLYIWHFPVFEIITPERLGSSTHVTTMARFVAAFAVALASYWVVEQPFLRRKERWGTTIPVARHSSG